MSEHYILKCNKCNKVMAQCRCTSKDKEIRYATCDDCLRGINPKDAEIARLKKILEMKDSLDEFRTLEKKNEELTERVKELELEVDYMDLLTQRMLDTEEKWIKADRENDELKAIIGEGKK